MTKRKQVCLSFIENIELVATVYSELESRKLMIKIENQNNKGDDVKMSNVFKFLPHGIIQKSHTGIGATTCEIKSWRNSIIVEPLKVTAYNKFKIHGGLFIGTPPESSGVSAASEAEITEYLKALGFKKIFCVVDSLPTLMSFIPKRDRVKFFLLLDETDSIQRDSGFRSVMHTAMDIYKEHPEHMRATVTATPLEFNDPELANESITVIGYNTSKSEEVEILNTSNDHKSVVKLILEHFATFPNRKLVVALNSVKKILGVIKDVQRSPLNQIESEDIKIMCSAKRKDEVGEEFYHELNSDLLPAKLVFITAAYFSGYDLTEKYSLVIVINPRYLNLALSEDQCKQIAGRARDGLYNFTIIYDWQQEDYYEEKSASELVETAQDLMGSFTCLSKNLDRNPILKEKKLKTLSGIIATNEVSGRELLYWSETYKTYKVAYLSIDSILEFNRLKRSVFGRTNGYKNALEKLGYIVEESFDNVESSDNTSTGNSRWFESSLLKIGEVFELYSIDPNTFIFPEGENDFETAAIKVYKEYCGFVDPKYLGELICKACKKKNGWKKGIKSLKLELFFASHSPNSNFNYGIKKHFPNGGKFTHADLLSKWDHMKSLEPALGVMMYDPVFLLHRIFANVRSLGKKNGVKQYYISVTRAIKPEMVKRYKDEVSGSRFVASEYVA